MRPFQSTTDPQLHAFLQQVSRWPLALRHLHQRIAACFARSEPRHHALLYLQAILSDIPRKNGWQIAEHARQAHPYGMQRLLSRAVWDEAAVRDALRSALVQTLLPPAFPSAEPDPLFPVLVLDESGFPKRGRHSAGVGLQYCGVSGRVENCQVGVFLYDKWNRKTWFYPDAIMQTEGLTKELGTFMQSLVHEGQLYRDRHQRYCLETGGAGAQKIFTCTSGCPLELWLNSSWIAGHVEGDGENYWFFANNGGKVLLTEQMTVRYIERW